jgi:hypothetical protein
VSNNNVIQKSVSLIHLELLRVFLEQLFDEDLLRCFEKRLRVRLLTRRAIVSMRANSVKSRLLFHIVQSWHVSTAVTCELTVFLDKLLSRLSRERGRSNSKESKHVMMKCQTLVIFLFIDEHVVGSTFRSLVVAFQ